MSNVANKTPPTNDTYDIVEITPPISNPTAKEYNISFHKHLQLQQTEAQ